MAVGDFMLHRTVARSGPYFCWMGICYKIGRHPILLAVNSENNLLMSLEISTARRLKINTSNRNCCSPSLRPLKPVAEKGIALTKSRRQINARLVLVIDSRL